MTDSIDSLIQSPSTTRSTEVINEPPSRPTLGSIGRSNAQSTIAECERLMAESDATGIAEDWHSLEKQRTDLLACLKVASTQVFVVTAEHPHVPGVRLRVCGSKESADAHAAELVNTILQDCSEGQRVDLAIPEATAQTWETTMETLQDLFGAAHCWAEVKAESILP